MTKTLILFIFTIFIFYLILNIISFILYLIMLSDDNIKDIIVNQLQNDGNSELPSVIFPIHYLFDGYINENIGNSIKNIRNIRDSLKLDDYDFENNATYINVPNHATILYKIKNNDRLYLYYSNSGLGADHHIIKYSDSYIYESEYLISIALILLI